MDYQNIKFEEFSFEIPEYFSTLLSYCCNVRVIDGAGCSTCKTCPKCKKFLGCWNLAGRLIKDKNGNIVRY